MTGLNFSEKKTMKRKIWTAPLAIVVLLVGVGCGDGFSDTKLPELSLEEATGQYTITQMGPRDRDRTMGSVGLRNVGVGEMEVTKIEWVQKPSRLDLYHDGEIAASMASVSCNNDSECGSGGLCLTASNTCRDLGAPPTPIEVRPDALLNLSVVVTASEQAVQCPEPGENVPQLVRERYCGELLIETNARNDGQNVEEGNARIYFITDGSSGLMALSETFLSFAEVTAGGSVSQSFTILNEDTSPLTVVRATFSAHGEWFQISPPISYTEIGGMSSQTFTLHLEPPTGTPQEELDFSASLTFESTSRGTSPSIFLEATAGLGEVPQIQVNPGQLSFAEATSQTLEIENHGGGTLMIQRFQITPASVADYYTLSYEGEEIGLGVGGGVPNLPAANGEDPTVREILVEFDGPADESVSTVGMLEIRHNDTRSANPVQVMLLGDAQEVALGDIGTEALRLVRLIADGGAQVRSLPLYNNGNAALEITGVSMEAGNSNTEDEDYSLQWSDGPIEGSEVLQPGELRELVVEYAGGSPFSQNMTITLESPNHGGQPEAMMIHLSGQTGTESAVEVEIEPSFASQALVGELTSLEVEVSGGGANLENAQWLTLQRPAGSTVRIENIGDSVSFVPDVAGDYRVAVQVRDDASRDVQAILEFTAVTN